MWQIARKIKIEIFEFVKKFSKEKKYRLTDQMIRSSRSISDNISEEYGRYHFQENIQFCRIVKGPAYELINHLYTAKNCSYLTEDEFLYLKIRITYIRITNNRFQQVD